MIINLFTLLSCLLLFCFIFLGIGKFGILSSYSAYSSKWPEVCKLPLNIWSVITFFAAVMLIPILIINLENNPLQFVGFLTPAYLIFVAVTPNWEKDKSEHIIHSVAAGLCAVGALVYIILIAKVWWVLLVGAGIALIGGLVTKTLKSCIVFWLEILMFLSVYITILIS